MCRRRSRPRPKTRRPAAFSGFFLERGKVRRAGNRRRHLQGRSCQGVLGPDRRASGRIHVAGGNGFNLPQVTVRIAPQRGRGTAGSRQADAVAGIWVQPVPRGRGPRPPEPADQGFLPLPRRTDGALGLSVLKGRLQLKCVQVLHLEPRHNAGTTAPRVALFPAVRCRFYRHGRPEAVLSPIFIPR